MFRAMFTCLQERETEIFTAHGIVSCCCGSQGFGELYGMKEVAPEDGQKIARNMLS